MSTLRNRLTDLAQSFADEVIAALRGASLDDLLSERGARHSAASGLEDGRKQQTRPRLVAQKPSRLRRRSPEEIARALDLVAKLVKSHPRGMRAEEIRKKLGIDVREMPRVLKEGLVKKKLRSKGQKRATTYFAA
jgi:hypothetical protein